MKKLKFVILGFIFGVILIKAEVISWFRIQEMFRFQGFHMYGIFATAIPVAGLSLMIIKRFKMKSMDGEEIVLKKKEFSKGNIFGGLIFGLGWALTGACPGPLYALIGSGLPVIIVVFLSAVLGTYVYGMLKERLPH